MRQGALSKWKWDNAAVKHLMKALVLALALFPATAKAAADDASRAAVSVIETLNSGLQEAMNAPVGASFAERMALLQPMMSQAFDYPLMAKAAAGRYWSGFSDEEKGRYVRLFEEVSAAAAASRFQSKPGSAFTVTGVREAAEGRRFVETTLSVPGRAPMKIGYLLQSRPDGTWKAVDLFYNGTISELATKRSEYTSVLRQEGLAGLLAKLTDKIAQYARE